jgi:hypothetical protein
MGRSEHAPGQNPSFRGSRAGNEKDIFCATHLPHPGGHRKAAKLMAPPLRFTPKGDKLECAVGGFPQVEMGG